MTQVHTEKQGDPERLDRSFIEIDSHATQKSVNVGKQIRPSESSRPFWAILLCLVVLTAVLGQGDLFASSLPEQADTQATTTFTSRWEGTITPDNSRATVMGETFNFDVTYGADGDPAAVTVYLTYQSGSGGTSLSCSSGGLVSEQISIDPLFIAPNDPTGWFFTGTAPHPEEGSLAFTGASGVVGPINKDGLVLTKDQAAVTMTRNYIVNPPEGGTQSLACAWVGTAQCVTNCSANVSLDAASYEVREAEGVVVVTVNRVAFGETDTTTVDYATSNGSATAGSDYTSQSGTLTFAPEEFSKTIEIPIQNNAEIEGAETFTFALSNPSTNTELGAVSQATITIEDRPDLTIDAFTLPIDSAVQEGSGYRLSDISVTVRNLAPDGETIANVPVRFMADGTQIHQEIVSSLPPNGSQTFEFDWLVTESQIGSGANAELSLVGTIDPADATDELNEGNNQATATGSFDIQPQIIAVNPQFTLDGHYFLDNQNVQNQIEVLVDWNGELPGTGIAPFGSVFFELNGDQVEVAGTAAGGTHTYDMGSDFNSDLSCANNTLKIWAERDDIATPITTIQPTVFPFPEWVEWVIQNIPGSDGTFDTTPKAPLVEYAYQFKYPEPAFEAIWDVPEAIPYLGGQEIGILESQAMASALGRSNGLGEVGLSGGTGLGLAAADIAGEIGGVGEVKFKCGESLDLLSTTLTLNVNATIEKEMGLSELFPPLAAAEGWAVVGRVVAWINRTAEVNASIQPAVDIETTFIDKDAEGLVFESGEGTGSVTMDATLSVAPVDGLEASVSGGGAPYVTVQVPANPSYLKEVGIVLTFEAMLEAWFFDAGYETEVNCNSNGGCSVTSEEERGFALLQPQLISRTYAGQQYDIYLAGSRQINGETTLLANIYPRPETAVAVDSSSNRLVAAVHDDTNKPQGRGTEIRVLAYDGSWDAPILVTDDQQPDFNPTLGFDGSDQGLLLWERSNLATDITPSLNVAFAQSLEIYSSVWNGITWTMPVSLTDNSLMDHAPQLEVGSDGTVLAIWHSGDGTDMLGSASHPVAINWTEWDGANWSATAVLLTNQEDLLKSELAVRSATEAAVVVTKIDGANTVLHYTTFNGTTWSGLTAITSNGTADAAPQLAYDSVGNRHLVWWQDGQLLWLKNSWTEGDADVILTDVPAGGVLEMDLVADSNGRLALVWSGTGDGQPDLMRLVYDGSADEWSLPRPLTDQFALEGAIAPVFEPDGTLAVAYGRTARSLATAANGAEDVPVLGETDLAFVTQALGVDLQVSDLALFPANPMPGTTALITATVVNAGDLTASATSLRFNDNGSPISTPAVDSLAGGMTATVTTTWSVPNDGVSHELNAIVDIADSVSETDEGNNEKTLTAVLPDLEIDLLYAVTNQDGMTITAQVLNDGVIDSGSAVAFTIRAGDPDSGAVLASISIPALAAQATYTGTVALTAAELSSVTADSLWGVVDSADAVSEADENNNAQAINSNLLPDLQIEAADISGGAGELLVMVHNNGLRPSAQTTIAVDGGSDVPTDGGEYTAVVPALAAGEDMIVSVGVPDGSATYGLKVDPLNQVEEVSESNNGAIGTVTVTADEKLIYLPIIARD